MRNQSLKLLPIFIILFLLVYALFTSFTFVYAWLLLAPHSLAESFQDATAQLPDMLLQALPPAIIFSLFALLFFRRNYRRSLTASLLVLITASALYGGLFYYLSGIDARETAQQTSFQPLEERQLQRLDSMILYAEEIVPAREENRQVFQLETVLAADMEDGAPHMRIIARGTAEPGSAVIRWPGEREPLEYTARDATGLTQLRPPRLLRGLLAEIAEMVANMRSLLDASLVVFGIAVFAQILWAVSSWGLLRLSSWPVFNALLAILAFRGLFFLWQVFRSDIIRQTVSPLLTEKALPMVPAGFFVLFALLMLAWSSLFRHGGEAS